MKHLTDLTDYKGVLPYASELFGVYQPLLAWKGKRTSRRIASGAQARFSDLMRRYHDRLRPDVTAHFDPNGGSVRVSHIGPASAAAPSFEGLVVAQVARLLPSRGETTPAVWDRLLEPEGLIKILKENVVPHASALYRSQHQLQSGARMVGTATAATSVVDAETAARDLLARESRVAGVLQILRENHQYDMLQTLFFERPDGNQALWSAIQAAHDPFDTIDPTKQLDRVGLSPVGVAHLFRQYFFELDTFLGPPVGHVWVSPGANVELIEVHTRRVATEQSVEQSIESIRKSETSTTTQDELSDAVKQDNRSDTKLGVSVSSSQNFVFASATESASLGMDNTQSQAREQTHKSMRQQSAKLSSEIKQNYKTTFRTSTETTDMVSKRYLLTNGTDSLINYELRRKMRQVAVQVQDVGSYLCWQTYVDNPGWSLGLARLVHVGAPPDLSQIPPPDLVTAPDPFTETVGLTIPFIPAKDDDASNDDTFMDGAETSLGFADSVNHIVATFPQGPVRCQQAKFKLAAVSIDVQGADAQMSVNPKSIKEVTPGSFTFDVHLDKVNFQGLNSLPVKATLNWIPIVDEDELNKTNTARMNLFTAREEATYRAAFVEEARKRISLASNIRPRSSEDLREEERIVIYRALIQDMLAPEKLIPQPDHQTQHVVAELLNSIFDIDKMLYFVAPEWWRPRPDSHQQLGGMDPVTDPITGKPIVATKGIPVRDLTGWGDVNTRADNYYITEDSLPARMGSSLGWLLQLDGDDLRNAFLNAPWVKAILPIRPGKEKAALNWLQAVEGTNGIGPNDLYQGPEPEWRNKPILDVLKALAEQVQKKHENSLKTQEYKDPIDDSSIVNATPVDRVFEHGFDPLQGGFRANVKDEFEIFDQWLEVLPTDQVVAVEVKYDPKTGRQQ